MQQRLREEELRILRGQTKVEEQSLNSVLLNAGAPEYPDQRPKKPTIGTGRSFPVSPAAPRARLQ